MFSVFLKLSIPVVVTNVIDHTSIIINSVFAGHMNDPIKLAVVGLSNVCCMIMVQTFLIGLNSAQETLTSQAFGANSIRLCGVYLNRGRFILTVFFIGLAIWPLIFGE